MALNWDMIAEILIRLSAKDILRYKLVCKTWRSLIDGPDFIKLHLLRRRAEPLTTLVISISALDLRAIETVQPWSIELFRVNIHSPEPLHTWLPAPSLLGPQPDVLGSANGLLALQGNYFETVFWNPTTKMARTLPPCQVGSYPSAAMVKRVYGFGHDPVRDDYKLIEIIQISQKEQTRESGFVGGDYEGGRFVARVYLARTRSWKTVCAKVLEKYSMRSAVGRKSAHGALLGHRLHWVVSQRSLPKPSSVILSFDLVTETFGEVPLPDYKHGFVPVGSEVDVVGGRLFVPVIGDYGGNWVEMWSMKEYGVKESWSKVLCVEGHEVDVPGWPRVGDEVSISAFFNKDGKRMALLRVNAWMVMYDMEDHVVGEVWIVKRGGCFYVKPVICVESVVRLEDDGVGGVQGWKPVVHVEHNNERRICNYFNGEIHPKFFDSESDWDDEQQTNNKGCWRNNRKGFRWRCFPCIN